MFTIENFIHGIANVTKSLKASICGDSLIVNRICYDYETSNDYEELFAQISLEQIQPIIELLADNYICTDKKYSLQGTTQGRYLTGGVPPVRFSMLYSSCRLWRLWW